MPAPSRPVVGLIAITPAAAARAAAELLDHDGICDLTESLLRLCHPAGKSAPAEPGDDAAAASFRGASRRNRPGGRIWSAARLAADLERLQCELEREASTLLAQACDNEK